MEVRSPWPEQLPKGRLLDPKDRHATLAFLGNIPYQPLLQLLERDFPIPSFQVGLVGIFSKCLFLPHRHPHVVAWDVQWTDESQGLIDYRITFLDWLKKFGYFPSEHEEEWLCHVTLCRKPFNNDEWKKSFKKLPMAIFGIHLYESLGHSKYKPIWSYPLIPPFEEIEHTADIAYLINGENLMDLHHHAQTALAFRYPQLIPYMKQFHFEKLDDVIMGLNEMVAQIDGEIGCPFKAISFHDRMEKKILLFNGR